DEGAAEPVDFLADFYFTKLPVAPVPHVEAQAGCPPNSAACPRHQCMGIHGIAGTVPGDCVRNNADSAGGLLLGDNLSNHRLSNFDTLRHLYSFVQRAGEILGAVFPPVGQVAALPKARDFDLVNVDIVTLQRFRELSVEPLPSCVGVPS